MTLATILILVVLIIALYQVFGLKDRSVHQLINLGVSILLTLMAFGWLGTLAANPTVG